MPLQPPFRQVPLPLLLAIVIVLWASGSEAAKFPTERPARGCYPKPFDGQELDITPPGFCWWRAAKHGEVKYRLRVMGQSGAIAYESPLTEMTAHVPSKALPVGQYTWSVEAMDPSGKVTDSWGPRRFTIQPGAFEQPWVMAEELLARVPKDHPRLLFPKAQIPAIRETFATTRRGAVKSLRSEVRRAMKLDVPEEPDYDKAPTRSDQRLGYLEAFGRMRKYHDSGMRMLAMAHALEGDVAAGEKAKAILLGAAEWDPEGISSILSKYGDEIGLGLAKAAPEAYDWVHDLLSEAERAKVKGMLVARAEQLMRRLQKADYLASPEESHNGRLPGFLVEHAIALAEEPRAAAWMDYAMLVLMTVYPHWGGYDGGWAEGISYGMAYNSIYLVPFEALRVATGLDLWRRPFYRDVRRFFSYCVSPIGDIRPFGDTENEPMRGNGAGLRSLLVFHANLYNDPATRWWADFLVPERQRESLGALPGMLLEDRVVPKRPATAEKDAAFYGVGWAALHSDFLEPERDLFLLFKSSPYGAVSHSHADQNSFALMKGGRSLAIPSGVRYPTHGSPFHTGYTQQTIAHNAVLVDGRGQQNRDGLAGGKLVAFKSGPRFGYVCGDASDCFSPSMGRNLRHVLLIRPSVVCIVDELAAPGPVPYQWLLHAHKALEVNEPAQALVSRKDSEAMTVRLFTPGGFAFSQTDAWPMDPKEGYPNARAPLPEKQWHFTAATREKAASRRIAAIMLVDEDGRPPDCDVVPKGDTIEIRDHAGGAEAVVRISLGEGPVLHASAGPESIVAFGP